jgi:hypothetical protein
MDRNRNGYDVITGLLLKLINKKNSCSLSNFMSRIFFHLIPQLEQFLGEGVRVRGSEERG